MELGIVDSNSDSFEASLGVGLILLVGILLGVVELLHIQRMSTSIGIAAFAFLPFLINLTLIVAGLAIWRSRLEGREILRVAGWVLLGMVVLGLLATWTITHQNIRGRPFAHAPFVTVNNLSAGGLIGLIIGWYDAVSRRYRQQAETERNRLEFLHNILSHNLLNGLSIVQGNAELLKEEVDETARERLDRITARSEELSRFARSTKTLMDGFLGEPSIDFQRYDLSEILTTEMEKAQVAFDHGTFSAKQIEEVEVLADEFLSELFRNLLTNAVEHNDQETPKVEVTTKRFGEAVIVEVRDNGPGIPDAKKERVLEWNMKGVESTGTGLGLAIANTLTERYNGSLSILDNEPRGTIVQVNLPIADSMTKPQ